ncbi:phosphatidylethanolamine-binding proteinF40A3.3-like [Tropilaelaps mercedesae]|uniref:Phosphatidylethanolamine-binding proteinF40A3.3-like n=1 Tax=Tropilaelaps mercedesae TaxID=418985 RepID=A0A1V9X8B0_9ACAR|nr:phosphatidylethanolamine-binding proteinF40A3.3-like [Tropilaelaps mercedesae]
MKPQWCASAVLAGTLVVMLLLFIGVLGDHEKTMVKQRMEESKVVPDVLAVAPKGNVKVDYGNGVQLHLGNTLTPTQVKSKPTSITWVTEKGAIYTLVMVDPDAPSRTNPTLRNVKHWLVVNIPGTDIEKGEEIAGYRGSGPPKGSGLHRYVFVVYKQPGRINVPDKRVPSSSREDRLGWSLQDFIKKYDLGEPVAGNFYLAEWDAYVDTIPK